MAGDEDNRNAGPGLPVEITDEGVRLRLRVTPKASADRIQKIEATADGSPRLKVQVTSVPEDGKANAAVIKLLAKAFRVPKTSLSVISGATDRNKLLLISGDGKTLLAHVTEQLARYR